jgi:hypothetical protein
MFFFCSHEVKALAVADCFRPLDFGDPPQDVPVASGVPAIPAYLSAVGLVRRIADLADARGRWRVRSVRRIPRA